MKRALVVLAIAACGKQARGPKLRLDGGVAPAVQADAAPPPDAPPAPAREPVATKVAVGERTSCALLSDATVRCWSADAPHPSDPQLRGVKDVVASHAFACALLDDGSVACWGDIRFGDRAHGPRPTAVPGVTNAKRLFALGGAACAAIADGSLACWGDVDARGYVTDTGAQRAPTAVVGVDHVVQLAERAALRDDGDAITWVAGAPVRAQIDDGKEVGSTGDVACVLRGDARAYCIAPHPLCVPKPLSKPKSAKKAKGKGRKPAPPPAPPAPALAPLPLPDARHLALDFGAPCVIDAAHRLVCVDPADSCRAAGKPALTGVDAISGHCARTVKATAVCWSEGGKPAAIAGVAGIAQLAASAAQACALDREHRVWCWQGTGPAVQLAL